VKRIWIENLNWGPTGERLSEYFVPKRSVLAELAVLFCVKPQVVVFSLKEVRGLVQPPEIKEFSELLVPKDFRPQKKKTNYIKKL